MRLTIAKEDVPWSGVFYAPIGKRNGNSLELTVIEQYFKP